jgi:hypothetical protein
MTANNTEYQGNGIAAHQEGTSMPPEAPVLQLLATDLLLCSGLFSLSKTEVL